MATNAGNVVALLKQPAAPTKKYVIWAKQLTPTTDPDNCELRVFNRTSGTWDLLLAGATVTEASAIHVKLTGITEQIGGRGPGDYDGSLLDLLRAMFIRPVAVVLTTPSNTVASGATIVLTATVNDPQGLVDHIAVYDGVTYLGTIQGSSGTLQTPALTLGEHRFTGQVTDKQGFTGPASGLLVVQAGNASGGTGSGTGSTVTVDRFGLTPDQMNAVMALAYVDCDADPAATPSGTFPGQEFDAVDPADGKKKHYYCGRGSYVPGDPTTGVGPAWHCVLKIGV